ncbi:serine hydrolase [Haloprofundus marisrubri]|uniref:Serine hydrolase n=1 Tax=Haloprofundus marisrubri TaxID=1514971 RepID=A0A0W1RD91_9EURY|nr:serine hydrolase domain-containing protein [Haloprofundus marisrubri]KTG11465.1 serine hydrolase [Haloprofundus marisrubri]
MTELHSGQDTALTEFLHDGLEQDVYPGAVAAVGTTTGINHVSVVGSRNPNREKPMQRTTRFDAASLTKPVVTTTVALSLVEDGQITLSDTLAEHLPALNGYSRGDRTLQSLLTHSSGFQPYGFDESWDSVDAALAGLQDISIVEAPSVSRFKYSCLNFIYLAAALRGATGESLSNLAEKYVFDRIGMKDSELGPLTDVSNIAATYDHQYRNQILRGDVHDPLGWAMNGESGNAGLFTTVDDLAAFAQAYLKPGKVLSAAMLKRLQADWLPKLETPMSLGWRLAHETYPAPNWSESGLGHTGYTGTSLWLNHESGQFAILLTNQVYDGKETGLIRLREQFHAMVAANKFE